MSKSTKRSAQPIRLTAQTEAEFLQQIIQAARAAGWLTYHVYDSRLASDPGFPDLVCCHPTVFVHPRTGKRNFFMVETKKHGGRLSAFQKEWMAALKANEVEVHKWEPEDAEEIIDRLQVA